MHHLRVPAVASWRLDAARGQGGRDFTQAVRSGFLSREDERQNVDGVLRCVPPAVVETSMSSLRGDGVF